ncbi:hypothetical protein TIFTF001_000792 [Ficus carica]|uniref:Nodulin-like domain-containing protein n=1 Tax=Ficus carica TaxID=3494 RepID=A0AA88D2D9_FICCA|nr:hypothetical protein TIFTF001_000792 [Ficus carica]
MSSEAPLLGCEIFAKTKQVLRGRWFMILSAIMIMSFSGSTFIFEAYSDDIKTALDYDQTTINLISAYKNAASNIGIVAGLIAEVVPTWLVLLIGAVANLLGYGFLWLAVKPKRSGICVPPCSSESTPKRSSPPELLSRASRTSPTAVASSSVS